MNQRFLDISNHTILSSIGSKNVDPGGEKSPSQFFQEDDLKASSAEKAVKDMLARSVLEGHPALLHVLVFFVGS